MKKKWIVWTLAIVLILSSTATALGDSIGVNTPTGGWMIQGPLATVVKEVMAGAGISEAELAALTQQGAAASAAASAAGQSGMLGLAGVSGAGVKGITSQTKPSSGGSSINGVRTPQNRVRQPEDPLYAAYARAMDGRMDAALMPVYFEADLAALGHFVSDAGLATAADVLMEALLSRGEAVREGGVPALVLGGVEKAAGGTVTVRYLYTSGAFEAE